MKEVKSEKNQTVFDIAKQHYGDVAMFFKILELNPTLENDYSAVLETGYPAIVDEFDLAFPIKENSLIFIDPIMTKPQILREIANNTIISFDKNILKATYYDITGGTTGYKLPIEQQRLR